MDAASIRAKLKEEGYTFVAIADALAVSASMVSRVARRDRHNHRVAVAIATALKQDTKAVFPDYPPYHRPYRAKDVRQRDLTKRLAANNLIQGSL